MMKRVFICLICTCFTSCQTNDSIDQIVSQTFVHKYGFETTEEEWEAREQDGLVVSMLKNGVKVTRTYENGQLHGPTTYTFPHSVIPEKIFVYDQGTLLKEQLNDPSGMPIREEIYEFGHRTVTTFWDEKGVPLSIEQYDNGLLTEGKYYTAEHELEGGISSGKGERVKRDRSGSLISRDVIQNGAMIFRTTFHPNGKPHTISHYQNFQLHGPQTKFTSNGKPLMELNWNQGVLDGNKTVYRNGYKIALIPYVMGKKNGVELHFDDLGTLTAEIEWRDNKKHGTSKIYEESYTDTKWFFKGQLVSADKFKNLESREKIISEFHECEAR